MKILIAEDEDDIRRLLALNMKKEGYEVIQCKDGIEALEVFKNQEVHLALLDIMMPNIDGITVMEEIRKTSVIPIIFITAMSTDSDKVLALGLGADDYIVKPVNAIELTARVASHLRRWYKYVHNKEEYTEIVLGDLTLNKENYEVYKNLDKEKIAQIAIENYDLVKEYIDIVEKRNPNSFGELMKTTLRYVWYELSKDIATNNRFSFGEVTNDDSFFQKIKEFVGYFKDFVELRSGYKLLRNDKRTTPRIEEDVQ